MKALNYLKTRKESTLFILFGVVMVTVLVTLVSCGAVDINK